MAIQLGQRYVLEFHTRDLGYGSEYGYGEYIAVDVYNLGGGQGFEPVDGGEVIYLFEDEIVAAAPVESMSIGELDSAGQRLVAAYQMLDRMISSLGRYATVDDEVRGALDTVQEIGMGLRGI